MKNSLISITKFNIKEKLIPIFIFLFSLIPFFSGHERYIVPVLFALISILFLKRIELTIIKNDPVIFMILMFCILFTVIISIGLIANHEIVSIFSYIEIFKYSGFFIVFLFSYLYIDKFNYEKIIVNLLLIFKIIIIIEFILCIDQMFEFDFLSNIYSYDKSSSLFVRLRSVGSFNNPNALGFYTLQFLIFIYLFDKKKTRLLWIILSLIIIFISGSKSSIILTFLAFILVVLLLSNYKLLSINTLKLFIKVIISIIFLFILIYLIDKFVYYNFGTTLNLAVLFDLIQKGPQSLTTIAARFDIWENAYIKYATNLELINILFGYSDYFTMVDNNYLFVYFRYGIVGIITFFALYSYILIYAIKRKEIKLSIFIIQYIAIQFIQGLQSDNLGGWMFPLLLFLFFGMLAKIKYVRKGY